jgi:hypothetical protein
LRDVDWWRGYIERIRAHQALTLPPARRHRIAIWNVVVSDHVAFARAARRAAVTGRVVPRHVLAAAIEQVPRSVAALTPLVDVVATFCTDDDAPLPPRLVGCTGLSVADTRKGESERGAGGGGSDPPGQRPRSGGTSAGCSPSCKQQNENENENCKGCTRFCLRCPRRNVRTFRHPAWDAATSAHPSLRSSITSVPTPCPAPSSPPRAPCREGSMQLSLAGNGNSVLCCSCRDELTSTCSRATRPRATLREIQYLIQARAISNCNHEAVDGVVDESRRGNRGGSAPRTRRRRDD